MPIILRMVLDERIHGHPLSGEVRNHIGLGDDDLSVQDVVVGVVAVVDYKGEVDYEACRVALAVSAGIGLVGWQTVVGEEFVLALAIDDDASACALHF